MSMSYWMCEGIGIRTNDLYPFLNAEKCIKVIKEQLPDEKIDEETFDIDEYFYGEPFQNLGDLLCHVDDTNTLTYGDNGYGEHYLYYTRSYPWERRNNEPQSIEEVYERIIAAVIRICDISPDDIRVLVDEDIYDYGCG